MALVRAIRLGVASHGGKVKPGEVFEHAGPLASWMEFVEANASPAPSKIEQAPAPELKSEAAADDPPAEAKARKPRKGAE